jgi:hypothetical protein
VSLDELLNTVQAHLDKTGMKSLDGIERLAGSTNLCKAAPKENVNDVVAYHWERGYVVYVDGTEAT